MFWFLQSPMALKLFLFALLISLPTSLSSTASKGKEQKLKFNPYRYTFIDKASTFASSSSSSFSSNGRDSTYDYIVIGGGTAGCPLAATLSRNFSVLVLERGGVPFTNANVSFLRNFHIGLADTSASSASQAFVSTDGVYNARARVLGGGSCINAGFYSRADAAFVKRAGWDPKLVNESYPWVEREIVHQPKLTLWQKALRDSLLEVGVRPFNGYTYDHVSGTKIGGTIFDRFGRRHTAAELLAYANPQKLRVLIYATVQKIVFDTSGARPRVTGVIFKDENGNQHQALLSNRKGSEVILSSGAIGSPQMLMLSGIGPKRELQRLKIPLVLENEHVGKGMADNPMNTILVPSKQPIEQSLIQTVGITKMGVYVEASTGFGQSPESIHTHYGVMSDKNELFSTIPAKQRRPEATQAYIRRNKYQLHEAFNGSFILEKLAYPISMDIISRFNERSTGEGSRKWSEFPSKVAVQMNDTHPTLAIPELMRLLMDDNGLGWDEAWDVTSKTVAYTNHTVLPEALEKWSQSLMRKLLPRHMEIIEEIDKRFVQTIRSTRVDLEDKLSSLSILDHNPQKPVVRMANLCVVSSHTVNGVAQLHSDILKDELFADYVSIWPNKFQNKTNGITPRRWLRFCSPELSDIITKWLKTDKWITDLDLLTGLRQFADNEELQSEWASAKEANKQRLAQYIERVTGVSIDTNSLFDIQVKRIHEYKRQLMNILGVIYRFKKLKEMKPEERKKTTPRTVMIGGKAFATYTNAKRIVKLVNDVGDVVNSDPEVNEYLKVVFVPNYNVTVAEMLIPGSELSQHISTAGMEASGTSNMKFALNGCLIIGTLDGANVEIREEIGEENFFLFGATADQVPRLRKEREDGLFKPDPRFEEAKQFAKSGVFGTYDYGPLLDSLEGNTGYGRGDYFLVGYDFASYMDAQAKVDEAYKDRKRWLKMSIMSTAGSGKFSSDRTIAQYAKEIWNIEACPVP